MINGTDIDLLSCNLSFWRNLNATQKTMITSNAKTVYLKRGQVLHCSEYECIGILFVKKGSIRTYILSEEGREVTLYRLEKNDVCILSASCVLETIDFDVAMETETDCEIIQIGSGIFSDLFNENVYVQLFSYKLATERFSDVMWAMQQILFTSFDKRLAAFLIDEAIKNNSPDIHMTHEQISKYLGSAREVVSRMLKYFSKEGYVTLTRGDIHIINMTSLRTLAE